jgi:hypothetical protein
MLPVLGRRPTGGLFVGDAVSDLEAAQAIGIPFVGRVPAGESCPFPPEVPVVADLAPAALIEAWSVVACADAIDERAT